MAAFIDILKKNGRLDDLKLSIGQIGSRKLSEGDDYGSQGWGIFGKNLTIYGFDADADATEEANQDLDTRQVSWREVHVPVGLSDYTGEATLYVTKAPMCTSLYPPNEPLLERFSGLPELMNLDFEIEVETTTLDVFCQTEGVEEIDFLKIDVQGADLKVLQGATQLLSKSVFAIQIEVEFTHLYKDQPLFADVDSFARQQGFTLFDLSMARRPKAISPIVSNTHAGQILWGDAFYFRDLLVAEMNQKLRTPQNLLKLACIADLMDFPDFAQEILVYLTINHGQEPTYNFANDIVESLAKFPFVVERGLTTFPVIEQIKHFITGDISQFT
jgi:FkbM family methyltransferase